MTETSIKGDAAAVIAAVEKHYARQGLVVKVGIDPGGRDVTALVVRDGERVQSLKPLLDEYLERPERLRGTTQLHDLPSFLAECHRFRGMGTTVYIDAPCKPEHPATITALFNDHHVHRSDDNQNALALPNWRDFSAVYRPALSPELLAWHSAQQPMSQEDFAFFIEEHLVDVVSPEPGEPNQKPLLNVAELLGLQVGSQARLLEVSRGLDLTVGQKIKGRANLHNGAVVMAFEEAHDTGPVTVPGAVLLNIPVFDGAQRVLILARVRYQVKEGLVFWRVLLHDIPTVFREAVEALRSDIAEAGHRVVLGKP
jgi:hypothetical protein